MSKRKLYLYSFFYFAPIIDALNGYLIFNHISSEGGLASPGQLYRLGMTLFSLLFLRKKDLILVFGVSVYFLSIEAIMFMFHNNIKGFILGFVYDYKLIYVLIIFLVFVNIKKYHSIWEIVRLFRNSALLYALILISSMLLGIDKNTYANGTFGSKGLFASGNGLSIFLGVSSLVAFYYYKHQPDRKNFFFFFIIALSAVLVGTKASIMFMLIIFYLLFFYAKFSTKMLVTVIVLFIVLYYRYELTTLFSTIFDVIILRYEHSPSLMSFLASNRDNYVADALHKLYLEGWYILRLITGAGVFVSYQDFKSDSLMYDTLENDFFDVFFSYGIIGVSFYLFFFLYGFILLFRHFNLILFLAWGTLFAYSIIAGHVIYNAMSNVALVMLFFIIYYNQKKGAFIEKNHFYSFA